MVKLTRAAFGSRLKNVARVNGYRKDNAASADTIGEFRAMFLEGRALEYIADNNIDAMKFEDPGDTDFIIRLFDKYPEAKAVASWRPIEKVLSSHESINKWGHTEANVLHQFSASLHVYRELHRRGQLCLINVESPESFDVDAFCAFLKLPKNPQIEKLAAEWEPVNTLEYQQEQHDGGTHGRVVSDRILAIRDIHPWIPELEDAYVAMTLTRNLQGRSQRIDQDVSAS